MEAKALLAISVSGFRRRMNSPLAWAMPRLQAAAKPRLAGQRMRLAWGNSLSTIWALPSQEALSTTIAS